MSIKINNYVFGDNVNVGVVDRKGTFNVVAHKRDLSVSPNEAGMKYYMAKMGTLQRQLLVTLSSASVKLSAGAMQMMLGNITMSSDVKGIGDLFGKAIKSKMTGDTAVKPLYSGTGYVITEPTYRHILLEDLNDWGGSMVCDDGMFLACDGNIQDTVQMRQNLSSAAAGGEGLFNLLLQGSGIVAVQSPSPREELCEIILNNDVAKIDGNMAVCWSSTLQFTVEKSGKSLVGSALSGEGLVNVYRGTGKILMRPV